MDRKKRVGGIICICIASVYQELSTDCQNTQDTVESTHVTCTHMHAHTHTECVWVCFGGRGE